MAANKLIDLKTPGRLIHARNVFSPFKDLDSAPFLVASRLGKDRSKPAHLCYSGNGFSISAHVQKGKDREECQDSVLVAVRENSIVLGVFDGYRKAGTVLSEAIVDSILALTDEEHLWDCAGAYVTLCMGISRMRQSLPALSEDMRKGGITAIVAVLHSDGIYSAASVSDSALYHVRPHEVWRQFNFRTLTDGKHITESEISLDRYREKRHKVRNTIRYDRSTEAIEELRDAELRPGQKLILASDGLTKQLGLKIWAPDNRVIDNSGSEDLRRIIQGKETAEDMTKSILRTINQRMRTEQSGGPYDAEGRPYSKGAEGIAEVRIPDGDDVGIVIISFDA